MGSARTYPRPAVRTPIAADHLVRMDVLARLAPEELGHRALHQGHAGHSTDEHHLVDLVSVELSVLQGALADLDAAVHEIAAVLLEDVAGDGSLQVQRLVAAADGDDERQVDVRVVGGGKLALGLLRSVLETL